MYGVLCKSILLLLRQVWELNAFFAFTVCGAMGYSYKVALTAVFIEGIIFMLLSLFKFREALVNQDSFKP